MKFELRHKESFHDIIGVVKTLEQQKSPNNIHKSNEMINSIVHLDRHKLITFGRKLQKKRISIIVIERERERLREKDRERV